jgi:hypothetical protein
MTSIRSATLGLLICLAISREAAAVPIMYTVNGTGAGFLNSIPFNSLPFRIVSAADTGAITSPSPGIYSVPNDSATLTLETAVGQVTATFTVPTISAVNQNNGSAGVSRIDPGLAILFAADITDFDTYDLTTSIGPLSGSPSFNPLAPFPTTAGDFALTQIHSNVTFQAAIVPEPTAFYNSVVSGCALLVAAATRSWFRSRRPVRIRLASPSGSCLAMACPLVRGHTDVGGHTEVGATVRQRPHSQRQS